MRNISNETIKNYIEHQYEFTKEDIEKITLYTIVLEDGRMGVTIHISNDIYNDDDTFIDFNEDVIYVENNIIELQKEIKELGTFLYEEYEVIAKVEMCLYGGLIEECVF